jgi:hypothetical protein
VAVAEGVATICEPFTEMTVTDVGIRAAASDAAIAVVTFKVGEFTNPDGRQKVAEDRLSLFLVKREDDGESRKVVTRSLTRIRSSLIR